MAPQNGGGSSGQGGQQPQTPVHAPQTPKDADLEFLSNLWSVELPNMGTGDDAAHFGGCRSIETAYEKSQQIGEGTYGQVYLAKDNETNEPVALKKIRMDNEKEGFPITAIREIKLLKTLDHDNVIRLKEIVRSQTHSVNNHKGSIYMVFDYMDHDLTGLMERKGYQFTVPHLKCYMQQLLEGLAYTHQRGVLHRDLKAANVLINNQGTLRLADFGLARPYRKEDLKYTNRVITLWYRPPELLLGCEKYGPEIDMWSVGCIFAELLVGKPLFPGTDETNQLEKISAILGSPNEQNMPGCTKYNFYNMMKHRHKQNRLRHHLETANSSKERGPLPPGALALLEQMLCLDPAKRITAFDASKHDFFYKLAPHTAERSQLPSFPASHEMDMKKRRQANNNSQNKHGQQQSHSSGVKRPRYANQQAPAPTAVPPGALPGYGPPVAAYAGGGYAIPSGMPPPGMGPGGVQAFPGPTPLPMGQGSYGVANGQGYAAPVGYPPGGGYAVRPPGAQPVGGPGGWRGGPPGPGYQGMRPPVMQPGGAPRPAQNPAMGYGSAPDVPPAWQKQRR